MRALPTAERLPWGSLWLYLRATRKLTTCVGMLYSGYDLEDISDLGTDLACTSEISATATVFSASDLTGPMPSDATLQTTFLSLYLFLNVIPVRWHTTDTEIIRLLASSMDASAASLRSGTTSTTDVSMGDNPSTAGVSTHPTETASQGSGSITPVTTNSSTPSSLTPGAMAGIVIGAFGVIAIVFAGWAFMRMQRRMTGGGPNGKADSGHAPSRHGWVGGETDRQDAYAELEVSQGMNEISAGEKDHAWEMTPESRPAELQ